MIEEAVKKRRFSMKWGTLIGLAVIVVATVLALLFAPPEGESNNVTGDPPPGQTGTTITNLVEKINVNQAVTYQHVQIKFTQAMLASKFSDDHKIAGTYTVRITTQATNTGTQAVGINYASLVRLILPDGQTVPTKLISVMSDQLPNVPQTGFIDFAVQNQVPLSALKLQFNQTIVPLKA